MEHSPSTIHIKGDRFLVDIEKDCLRLEQDPDRKLSFTRMENIERTGHYTFLYDPVAKQIYQPEPALKRLPPEILYVEIPGKAFLDPAAISRALGFSDKQIDPALTEQSRQEKDARIIPRVKFLDDEFFVDFRKMAFVDTVNLHNEISFDHAMESPKGTIFLEYDFLTRQIPDPFADDYIEETTAIIMLPSYPEMDPDGWKEIQKLSTNPLLNSIQPQPRQQAQTNRRIRKGPGQPPGGRTHSPRRRS